MNITREKLKETLRTIVNEEADYQTFFKTALEKAGKSIPSMSDEEKKAFFDKIDAAWDGKSEKNEELVGNQHKLDIDKDGDIGSDDLADLRAGAKVDEAKYPTDLKIGSVIKGQGFTRLKGIDGGKYYKIVDMDDTTATLTRTDPTGKTSSPTKVRHKLDSIEAGIKTAKRGDENGIVVIKESVNEAYSGIVGKTVFSDGKGKLFFGYYKEDDSVHFVDYKTWAKLSLKDVSKGDTNKDRVISSILKNQKQFNKKVDYNMWAKKTNPSFEEKMDWFMKNGWVSNITKGGIKESVINEVEEVKWNAVENAIINFLKANTKILDKRVKDKDLDGVKGGLKSIISGLTNAQRSLKLESVNEADINEENPCWKGYKQLGMKNKGGKQVPNCVEESVNEAPEVKKRFMFDFYTDSNQRNTERETNFMATTLESAIKAAEHICKVTGYAYVEIYYKDLFLGSMKKQDGFKFVEGRGYSKFKSTN